ncbi:MAG: zinc-dependent peptidase [Actinomycetota bacterium]|nr:zinc-dependent peptidase [Actinomycetota bacterium]
MRFETRHHRERRELFEAGFRDEWRELLRARVPIWQRLDDDERSRLEQLALELMADVHWEAANGFEITDEIKVTIATEACVLLLGLPDDSFRDVHTVLVHPTTVVLTGEHSQVAGIVSDGPMPILGQAELHGPVTIVWDAVQHEARHPGSGHNVVFHEFAHRLDMLDGAADGTPPMGSVEQSERWVQVCTRVYDQVVEGRGGTALRSYAGVNPAEFFAVATEAFFDDPVDLRRQQRELYDVLSEYYRQDPAARHR